MTKSEATGSTATRVGKPKKKERQATNKTQNQVKTPATSAKPQVKGGHERTAKSLHDPSEVQPIHVRHEDIVPEGLPKKYFLKSTFNTQDIMHAPVEKTLKMLDKILAGERLFTM